jgi:Putative Actinobacterial Holin-X, holin superfamily III
LPTRRDRDLNRAVPDRPPPLPQVIAELWELVVAYFKQETLVPLQQLVRVVAFGLAGALLLGFGVVCVTVGGLRLLQEETGSTFTGNWSWAPYAIMTVVLLVGGGLTWKLGTRKKGQEARTA